MRARCGLPAHVRLARFIGNQPESRRYTRSVIGRKGRLPGDRRVRVERVKPLDYVITPPRRIRRPRSPWTVLIGTFAALTVAGTILLALPFSTTTGQATPLLEALFMATSAVSTTGLVLYDTAEHWSPFGEFVILVLIQLGGFAFMTGSTLFLLALVGGRTSLSDRLRVQAAGGLTDLGSVTMVVRRVLIFTVFCEVVGAIVLIIVFLVRGEHPATATWWGVFHSVSAFNNGGVDLFGGFRGLTHLADAPAVLMPIGTLMLIGGLGFAIVGDIVLKRRWIRFALETKLVVAVSMVLLLGGALATAAFEWTNPATLGRLDLPDRVLNAVFHSISLRSGGMDAIGVSGLVDESLVLGMVLMFVGGASGSTAGGIKVNTLAVLLVATLAAMRGDPSAAAYGRRIPHQVVYRSIAVLLVAIAGAFGLAVAIQLTGTYDFLAASFESVSALGTAGMSTGLTLALGPDTQLLLVAAMFIGRLGPLTLVLAIAARSRPVAHRPAVESVRIG
jgi:trk system potassium uptake protein TrkH